jgi:hypothetical protein
MQGKDQTIFGIKTDWISRIPKMTSFKGIWLKAKSFICSTFSVPVNESSIAGYGTDYGATA